MPSTVGFSNFTNVEKRSIRREGITVFYYFYSVQLLKPFFSDFLLKMRKKL